MTFAFTWGTAKHERSLPFACDRHLDRCDSAWYRGLTVQAPPEGIYRWLCQLRVSSYTYGSRGPRELTPGLDAFVIGQTVMRSFKLVEFERYRHLTIRLRQDAWEARFVADVVVTYLIVPRSSDTCRLLVKTLLRHRRGPVGRIVRTVIPWGDLIMSRRQLRSLKALAERTASPGPPRPASGPPEDQRS